MAQVKYTLVRAGIFLSENPQRTRLIFIGVSALLGLALAILGIHAPGVLLAGPADGGDGGSGIV